MYTICTPIIYHFAVRLYITCRGVRVHDSVGLWEATHVHTYMYICIRIATTTRMCYHCEGLEQRKKSSFRRIDTMALEVHTYITDALWPVHQTDDSHTQCHGEKEFLPDEWLNSILSHPRHAHTPFISWYRNISLTKCYFSEPINADRCSSHTTLCQEIVIMWYVK